MDLFAFLPDDAVLQIALVQSVNNINRLCQTSRRFNNLICNNNYFWREKYTKDYGEPEKNFLSWRTAYQNYGRVVSFGNNYYGQLGLGDTEDRNIPTLIPNIRAKSISCGSNHTIIIDLNNNVWAFGDNNRGQLGLGVQDKNRLPYSILPGIWKSDERKELIPIQIVIWPDPNNAGNGFAVPRNINAKSVSCGAFYTMIIDIEDNLWAFGENGSGQLGLGDTKSREIPTLIPNIKAKAISCGSFHTMIIDINDNVWACGFNLNGELGLEDNEDRHNPTQIPNIRAKSISCGSHYTMIIDLNNNVWAFGSNSSGNLGLGNYQNKNIPVLLPNLKAKAISCGSSHTIVIDLNDNILAFGSNEYGELGLGEDDQDRDTPTQTGLKAKSIACGGFYTMIIDINDEVWAFGFNETGELGVGDNDERFNPAWTGIKARSISCSDHTVIILSFTEYIIPFDEAARKLTAGGFLNFNFLPEYQVIPHKSGNYIATFYGKDGNVYLVELQYNQSTNEIFPPVN